MRRSTLRRSLNRRLAEADRKSRGGLRASDDPWIIGVEPLESRKLLSNTIGSLVQSGDAGGDDASEGCCPCCGQRGHSALAHFQEDPSMAAVVQLIDEMDTAADQSDGVLPPVQFGPLQLGARTESGGSDAGHAGHDGHDDHGDALMDADGLWYYADEFSFQTDVSSLPVFDVATVLPNQPATTTTGSPEVGLTLSGATLAASASVPSLSSNPDSPYKLYLDFDGHYEAQWGSWSAISTPVFDTDGNAATFSDSEVSRINDIWARVSRDFEAFDIDVTTIEPADVNNRSGMRVAIGGSASDWYGSSAGGVAYVNTWTNSIANTVYVFENNLGNGNAKYVAEAASHEAGHGFGLRHQATWSGSTKTNEYNPGGNGWAPIMGLGYYQDLVTWHDGTSSSGSSSYQDDLSILSSSNNAFGYRDDDHGNAAGTATPIVFNAQTGVFDGSDNEGNIERMGDVDVFAFTVGAGTLSITIDALSRANLDTVTELRNAAGQVIATSSPSGNYDGSITQSVAAGDYTLHVAGTGQYGVLGKFQLSGSFTPSGGGGASNSDPVAGNDSLNAVEDQQLVINDATLLANDTDSDGDGLSIASFTQPANGTLVDLGSSLRFTPTADFSGSTTFTYTVSDGAGGEDTATVTINVAADADAPSITAGNVSGNEDAQVNLNISASANDSSESVVVRISGMPTGSSLSAGTNLGGGVWQLTTGQLGSVKFIPKANASGVFNLTATAIATESSNGDTASAANAFTVTVNAVGDTPTVSAGHVVGEEATAIALNVAAALTDTDGSETLTLEFSGLPTGASLSAGTNLGGGVWRLTAAQLSGLTLTPPAGSAPGFTVTVEAIATESSNGASASAQTTFAVTVGAVADTPTLNVSPASGNEDAAIALNIAAALTDTDGSETLGVTITGLPQGASLSTGTNLGGGVWSLTTAQLAGLTVTPPSNSDANFTLSVIATATESSSGDTASSSASLYVTVNASADTPTVSAGNAIGEEGAATPLNIAAAVRDLDGSESLSVDLAGLPSGVTLSAGTNLGGGIWRVAAAQLSGLTLTPPAGSTPGFTVTVTARATESSNSSTATAQTTFNFSVAAVADTPTLNVSPATGYEDAAIPLSIQSSLVDTDGSETLTITIAGVPTGATLSAGTPQASGVWQLTSSQLAGLTITPPADSDANMSLVVTATATESSNGDAASTSHALPVTVAGVADTPGLSAGSVSGVEDQLVSLNIVVSSGDTDGSESLSILIAGLPNGATLTRGVNLGGGQWRLTASDLASVQLSSAAHSDADFTLQTVVTATESGSGSTSQVSQSFSVSVDAVADQATLELQNVSAVEGESQPLNITLALPDDDGSESAQIDIAGVPLDASLTSGVNLGGGVWRLTAEQLTSVAITPGADGAASIELVVTVTTTESVNGSTATASDSMTVSVVPKADAPQLSVSHASGDEDQGIALNIAAALTDTDGSESLSIEIHGLPTGSVLSAGVNLGSGVWSLSSQQLTGLTFTPPQHVSGDITLTVIATAEETVGGDTASRQESLDVTIDAVADRPTVAVTPSTAPENAAASLNLVASLVDIDGSESLSIDIAGVPAGFSLSGGVNLGGGVYRLTPAELSGLTITPVADWSGQFTLTVTATATEAGNGDAVATVRTLPVAFNAVASLPNLIARDTAGQEDLPVFLDIDASLSDTDGSETLAIAILGVPDGAVLSAGTFAAGVWRLTPAELAGLTLTPPAGSDDDIQLNVVATSTEIETGASASAADVLTITLTGRADQPMVVTQSASGVEDQAIALQISGSLTDTDGSETLTYEITGVPAGASLSAGEDLGGGRWIVGAGAIASLSITPPAHSSDDFDLTVNAIATETKGGDTASAGDTLHVAMAPAADAPALTVADTVGDEDQAIPLHVGAALTDLDGSESLVIRMTQLPAGSTLSAGIDLGDGVWELTGDQLDDLTFTPPAHASGDFTLNVAAVATEAESGETATTSAALVITVSPVADQPTVEYVSSIASAGSPLTLRLQVTTPDVDGSESITIIVSDLPGGMSLSSGQPDAEGRWTFSAEAFENVRVLTTEDHLGTYSVTITAVVTEGSSEGGIDGTTVGETAAASTATVTTSIEFEITPSNLPPELSGFDTLTGAQEDEAFEITWAQLRDASDASDPDGDTVSFLVTSLGAGIAFVDGQPVTPGVTLIGPGESVTWFTPTDESGDLDALEIAAFDGEFSSSPATLRIHADAVNDAPTFVALDAQTTSLSGSAFVAALMAAAAAESSTATDAATIFSATGDGMEAAFRASGASDLEGDDFRLRVYLDRAGNGVIDHNDQLIGVSAWGDGTLIISTSDLKIGEYQVVAVLEDVHGAVSDPQVADISIEKVKRGQPGKRNALTIDGAFDDAGNPESDTSVTLIGSGELIVHLMVVGGEDVREILVSGTDSSSRLIIDAGSFVNYIHIDGDIKQIVAEDIEVRGEIDITGSVAMIDVRQMTGQLNIAGSDQDVVLRIDNAIDLSIDSASPLKVAEFGAWRDTDGLVDAIVAPSIKRLMVDGDFTGDLDLYGDGGGDVLSKADIGGSIDSSHWNLQGDAGKIMANDIDGMTLDIDGALNQLIVNRSVSADMEMESAGVIRIGENFEDATLTLTGSADDTVLKQLNVGLRMDDLDVFADGSVGKIIGGWMRDTRILIGADTGLSGHVANAGDFHQQSSIKLIKLTEDTGRNLENSTIAAWSIGKVSLRNVANLAATDFFGVAAHDVSKFSRDGSGMLKRLQGSGGAGFDVADDSGSFQLRLVG